MFLMFLMFLTFYLSLLFTYLSSPLAMGLFIIMLTITTTTTISLLAFTSWFSFLLIMIFLSGMMIVFLYICSLASNELSFMTPSIFTLTLLLILSNSYIIQNLYSINNLNYSLNTTCFKMMYKMYTYYMYTFTIFIIIYLLFTLMVVVKNSSITNVPFRMK